RAADATRRGAQPVAELAGWALGAEAHHITHPEASGATAANIVGRSLERAGLRVDDIDYVNAHRTGTPHNDAMEAAALKRVFGSEMARVLVSSSKGQLGHTLGAAGAIEAVVTAMCVQKQLAVPTAGLEEPDSALGLHHVLDASIPTRI